MILLRWFYIYMAVVRMGFTLDENSNYAPFRMTVLAVLILFSALIAAPTLLLYPNLSYFQFMGLGALIFILSLGLPALVFGGYGQQYGMGIEIKWYHIAITWTVIVACVIVLYQAINFSRLVNEHNSLAPL